MRQYLYSVFLTEVNLLRASSVRCLCIHSILLKGSKKMFNDNWAENLCWEDAVWGHMEPQMGKTEGAMADCSCNN